MNKYPSFSRIVFQRISGMCDVNTTAVIRLPCPPPTAVQLLPHSVKLIVFSYRLRTSECPRCRPTVWKRWKCRLVRKPSSGTPCLPSRIRLYTVHRFEGYLFSARRESRRRRWLRMFVYLCFPPYQPNAVHHYGNRRTVSKSTCKTTNLRLNLTDRAHVTHYRFVNLRIGTLRFHARISCRRSRRMYYIGLLTSVSFFFFMQIKKGLCKKKKNVIRKIANFPSRIQ